MRKFPRDTMVPKAGYPVEHVAASSSIGPTTVVRTTFAILLATVRLTLNAVDRRIRSTLIIERANRGLTQSDYMTAVFSI